jgi:hypothetical protein
MALVTVLVGGHIEQAERGAIRKSPQAHKAFCPILPTAMVFVSYGFVLVQAQVQASSLTRTPLQAWVIRWGPAGEKVGEARGRQEGSGGHSDP